MFKRIKTPQLIILIILFGATATLSAAQTPKTNGVADSAAIRLALNGASETRTLSATDCETDLATANQRLVKTLDALEKAESLVKILENEIEARKRLETVNNDIIKAKDSQLAEQKKLIEILEKQSQRKLKILWGIISVRF
jgi:hypothetical protein